MSKKSFFDPVANAKVFGFLYLLAAFSSVLEVIAGTISLIGFIFGVFYLVTGLGLYKRKLWGVYGVGLSVIIGMTQVIISGANELSIISVAISLLLFLWFYSARDRFEK